MIDEQPDTEKLSDHIGKLARLISGDVRPEHIAGLVEFHRRYLPHLQLFASDLEYAERQAPGPAALSLAAAASMRLYRRLNAPAAPIGAAPAMPVAEIIDLDRFRRSPPPEGDRA